MAAVWTSNKGTLHTSIDIPPFYFILQHWMALYGTNVNDSTVAKAGSLLIKQLSIIGEKRDVLYHILLLRDTNLIPSKNLITLAETIVDHSLKQNLETRNVKTGDPLSAGVNQHSKILSCDIRLEVWFPQLMTISRSQLSSRSCIRCCRKRGINSKITNQASK